jgi:hypothetical protein
VSMAYGGTYGYPKYTSNNVVCVRPWVARRRKQGLRLYLNYFLIFGFYLARLPAGWNFSKTCRDPTKLYAPLKLDLGKMRPGLWEPQDQGYKEILIHQNRP